MRGKAKNGGRNGNEEETWRQREGDGGERHVKSREAPLPVF